jgi:hypothetical protein
MPLPAALREPVVQFLLLGALLFAADRMLGEEGGTVAVSAATVARLEEGFAAREGRAPTASERAALVEEFADQERMIREARRLGLAEADPIVRRRLAQKLDLVAERTPPIPAPDEPTLQAWLDAHPDDFARPATTDGVAIRVDDAPAALAALAAGADPATLGRPGPYPPRWTGLTDAQRAGRYGADVAGVDVLGQWVAAGGWLVRVDRRTPARPATLDEVRDAGTAAWEAEARAHRRAALRARLRAEWPTERE